MAKLLYKKNYLANEESYNYNGFRYALTDA